MSSIIGKETLGGINIDLNHQIKILESLEFMIKSQKLFKTQLISISHSVWAKI